MSFTEAVASGFRRYFDFRTRSSRSEYWWWTLFAVLVGIATAILDQLIFGSLNTIVSLALFIPGLAVAVRRLHDVDRSGWWYLIVFTVIGIIFPLLYWYVQRGTQGTNKYGPDPLGRRSGTAYEGAPPTEAILDSPEIGQVYCSNCGSQAVSGAKFCVSCGAAL